MESSQSSTVQEESNTLKLQLIIILKTQIYFNKTASVAEKLPYVTYRDYFDDSYKVIKFY